MNEGRKEERKGEKATFTLTTYVKMDEEI